MRTSQKTSDIALKRNAAPKIQEASPEQTFLKEFSVQARKPDQGARLSVASQIDAITRADCLSTAAAAPNESAASASH